MVQAALALTSDEQTADVNALGFNTTCNPPLKAT